MTPNSTSPNSRTSPSILLVDDDERLRERTARAFKDRGYEVICAGDYDEAVGALGSDTPEFAVVDLRLPGRSGLDVVETLHRTDSATRIVVLTGYGSIATALQAIKLGAVHYLTKPADADDIIAAFATGNADGHVALDDQKPPSLARVEWEHIQRVLTDCDGNITKAAEKLGIHRRSLQRKLAKFPVAR